MDNKSLFWWVFYGAVLSATVSFMDMYFGWGIFPQ